VPIKISHRRQYHTLLLARHCLGLVVMSVDVPNPTRAA
jgi:hypothetical protein